MPNPAAGWRRFRLRLRGARIGRGTHLPRCRMVWPHQVSIGRDCVLQQDVFFNYDRYWTPGPSIILGERVFVGTGVEFNCYSRIEIGNDTLIAAGTRMIDHDHGMAPESLIARQEQVAAPIRIGNGVWIGANVVILKGVCIGDGAVVGAGAVVTRSIPAGSVWGGIPARPIGSGSRGTRPSGTPEDSGPQSQPASSSISPSSPS